LGLAKDFDVTGNNFTRGDVVEAMIVGGYPPVAQAKNLQEREEWFNSYLETYIQRDVRALSNIQNLAQFSRFVQLVAGRTATIINYSELGKDIGVNYKTAQHYLSLLSASYIWRSLAPFYQAGSERRITKSPKGVFLDTGLVVYLTGVSSSGLERSPLYGNLFESYVITELLKLSCAFGKRVNFTHFRMGERSEVDLVLEYGNKVIPIEIKGSSTIDSKWGKGIRSLREVTGAAHDFTGYVISLHPHVVPLGNGVFNVPLQCFL
jgi:predicted AAA+ superfamily ATPase